MSGKPTYEELAQAESERMKAEEALATKASLERVLSEASQRFLTLAELDKSINACLADIGRFCAAGRAYLFQFTSDGTSMNNTHEWCAPGVKPEIENLQGLPLEMFPWWMKLLKAGENIHVKNVSELPPEAMAEKEFLEAQDIKSVLVVPFLVENRLAGFLGFDHVASTRTWGEKELFPLRTLVDTIGIAVTRKHAENALLESEERLRLQIERMPIALIMWDNDFKVMTWNPAAENIFGYTTEEALGRHPYNMIVPKETKPIVDDVWDRLIQGDDTAHSINENITKDGSSIICSWTNTPIKNSNGSIIGVLSMAQDITERKQAEEKILKLNETLEQRVAKRTVELENRSQQLQQLALELSGAEDRERRNIASILHDDFQQQLAFIKMELDQVRKQVDIEAGQRLGLLAELTGGCIEKSRNLSYKLNPPALTRSGLIAALEALAEIMRRKHGLLVTFRKQKGAEPTSLTLASILYRSARELLLNVVKHAGVTSALLDVRSKNGLICLKVEDCGNGFDYDAVRAGQDCGTVFGLYNIEDRLTFLGGSIRVKTKPGKGCCVEMTVPKDIARKGTAVEALYEGIAQKSAMDVPVEPIYPVVDGEQIRVLLADDHKLMREALANSLHANKGLTIVGQAINGNEAVQMAAKLNPHVILMDVTMPELDGFEATAQITRAHPNIRIIALSMHDDLDTSKRMFDAGASAYLTKTDATDALVETIRRAYHGNAGTRCD